LCTEAAMGPIRSCIDIRTMDADAVRPIVLDDFVAALRGVRDAKLALLLSCAKSLDSS
jgi:hypothetical protein